jgi:hypothetical protein
MMGANCGEVLKEYLKNYYREIGHKRCHLLSTPAHSPAAKQIVYLISYLCSKPIIEMILVQRTFSETMFLRQHMDFIKGEFFYMNQKVTAGLRV